MGEAMYRGQCGACHTRDAYRAMKRLVGERNREAIGSMLTILHTYPNTKVIMLTSYAEDEMLFSAIRAGASGYMLKQVGSEDLIKAIEAGYFQREIAESAFRYQREIDKQARQQANQ